MNIFPNPTLSIDKAAMPSLILRVILYDLSVQKRLFDLKRINSSNSNALNAMTGTFKSPSGAAAKDFKVEGKHRLLRIESGKRGQNVYVSFQDTGSGIAPEHLLRIFEPFYSTQDKVSEVGLGLWVSHRTVTAHGGDITVKSDPERGSIFVVVLPVGV